jgi:hypothetical protein
VGLIQANVEGLSALAASCGEQASAVGGPSAPPPAGGSFQPSSAAVEAVHADVAAASVQFTARMQSTAAAVTAAAQGFDTTEVNSAAANAAVGAV